MIIVSAVLAASTQEAIGKVINILETDSTQSIKGNSDIQSVERGA